MMAASRSGQLGDCWRAADVAKWIGLSVSWVEKAAKDGDLPSFKLGRLRFFEPKLVQQWWEAKRRSPGVQR